MSVYRILLLLIMSCSFLQIKGQSKKSKLSNPLIFGIVIDAENNSPLEFATATLYSNEDNSVITGSMTDIQGKFEFSASVQNTYLLVEYIGYKNQKIDLQQFQIIEGKVDLGKIEIAANAEQLEEVTIRAERSQSQFALDKRVFNVGKDLANRGGTAEDLLDNVPSVTVDVEGQVSLRGSGGVRILINGKPSRLTSTENGLKRIPSNMIERVEVITNPSSRFEAEGVAGIINIILRKEKRSGFNGALNASLSYPYGAGFGANLNYRHNKVNWFFNYNYDIAQRPGNSTQHQEVYGADTLINDQTRKMERLRNGHTLKGGLEYYISEKSVVTAGVTYNTSISNNLTTIQYLDYLNNTSNLIEETNRTDDEREDESGLQYALEFDKTFDKKNHKLQMAIQYEDSGEKESSLFLEKYLRNPDETNQRAANDEREKQYLFKVDYQHPFKGKNHKLELGARSTLRNISNNYIVEEKEQINWSVLEDFTNMFDYQENVHAVYGQYGNEWNKVGAMVGVRAEFTDITTQLTNSSYKNRIDTFNLFPSVFLSYNFTKQYSLQASYTKRISRPRFFDLNPFFTYSNPRSFFSGNPLLKPEYTDSYELNFLTIWNKATLSTGLFYRNTINNVAWLSYFRDGNVFVTYPTNIGAKDDWGLELSGNYNVLKWLTINGNMNFFRSIINTGTNNARLDVETTIFTARGSTRFKFLGSSLQFRFNYRGPRKQPQGSRKSMYSVDIAWSKDFLKKKNFTLTLGVRDLLNTRKRRYAQSSDTFMLEGEFQWLSRVATLTAAYRINQGKKRPKGKPQY